MKYCYKCKELKLETLFYKNKAKVSGLSDECKECDKQQKRERYKVNRDKLIAYQVKYRKLHGEKVRARNRDWGKRNQAVKLSHNKKRKADKLQRTPAWLNAGHQFELDCIYTYAAALNSVGLQYHVDHIIPLQGDIVSGLHTPDNLQVITAEENLRKGNKYAQTTQLPEGKRIQIDPKTNRVTCQTE